MKCPKCGTEVDYQTIVYKNKEFRIYKWESKPFRDFPMPKGFDWCEYIDFVELINEKKIELEKYPVEYIVKNQFKTNTKDYPVSRVCLNGNSNLNSNNWVLDNSNGDGRVVVSRAIKEKSK